MTIQVGDTGRVATGSLKSYSITLNPSETLLGTPVTLPSTNPGNAGAQVTFTISASTFPTITPPPVYVKYTAVVLIAVKNGSGASATVSWQSYKNGTAGVSGTTASIPNGNYCTIESNQYYDFLAAGDTFNFSLYTSAASVTLDYFYLVLLPTRLQPGSSYINKDVAFTFSTWAPSLGTPTLNFARNFYLYPSNDTGSNFQLLTSVSGTYTCKSLGWNPTYNSGQVFFGEISSSTTYYNHATNRPYYCNCPYPSKITFREILR